MSKAFSISAGVNQKFEVAKMPNPDNSTGVISIQNHGPDSVVVKGRLRGATQFDEIGYVANGTIRPITILPGLEQIELIVSTGSTATGVVVQSE